MKKMIVIFISVLTITCLVACSDNASKNVTNVGKEETNANLDEANVDDITTYTEVEITVDNFFDYFTYEMRLTPYIDDFGDKKYNDYPTLIISIKDEFKDKLYYFDGDSVQNLRDNISEIPTVAIEYNAEIEYEKANIDTTNGTIEWTGDILETSNDSNTKKMYFYTLNGDPSFMDSDNCILLGGITEGPNNIWHGKVSDLQIIRAKGTIKLKNN